MSGRRLLTATAIVGLAGVYGAADQYLGSRVELGEWTVSVSQMSAPWLLIAFLAGLWPHRRPGAVVMGALVTVAAVAGYMAMTLSPVEGVAFHSIRWGLELRSQLHVILPALITGPAFGWLGWYWRSARSRAAAVCISGFLVLEPLARALGGRLIDPGSLVWPGEAALGIALAVALWLAARRAAAAQAV